MFTNYLGRSLRANSDFDYSKLFQSSKQHCVCILYIFWISIQTKISMTYVYKEYENK